ncbi:hypothetical protein TIFTF001_045165 [Ficus carica]|uniref:VWFA domain-containing protein n=1 Tax=Ficus carica TaxID=3494 RepID=A0AA87YUK0_FICCA|nr:hypothetical protein TIFTF001_045163 [Ficus carica]GMN19317.1 hypothetical protein TIFTF001_045165 [Ficus carica]
MTFNDDEPIVAPQDDSTEEKPGTYGAGKTQMTIINQPEAPLEETELKVLLELSGSGDNEDRSPVDIVAILDVSKSMNEEDKIGKLKIAVQFLIQKLSPIDRLSVVTFSTESKRLFPLRQITNNSQKEIIEKINALEVNGATNMADGLKTGLEVLRDRRLKNGRLGAIMLMSDGEQTIELGDAGHVDQLDNFPVHTFGFGSDAKPEVLKEIAEKSKGGTFSDVRDHNNLSKAFSQCLGGLLTVVVKDLNLTIAQVDEESKIKNVSAGNYPKTENDSSVTISFGELYNNEVLVVMVYLLLPKVESERNSDVLQVTYTYSSGKGKLFEAHPITAIVTRVEKATYKEEPKLILEENRLKTLKSVKEARVMADNMELEKAKEKVDEAQNLLEDVKAVDTKEIIKTLTYDLQQLSELMTTQKEYEEKGRPYALSFETSHERQRYAARGDIEKVRSFATPRMNAYLEEAKKFNEDPASK